MFVCSSVSVEVLMEEKEDVLHVHVHVIHLSNEVGM